ncbi:glucosamine-6-phosphate deaminase [Intestinimonas sp. HCP28S3_D6]|uniref:glucosamine-6-phosphate deaminase n=1 Tax=Intestinimonas sp. HCP28S3_D6 TaxID=3438942 RepID=UPI003F8B0F61
MRIYQEADYDAMSRRTAAIIAAEVIRKPDCVLGLATGSTPVGSYRQLVAWQQEGLLSFGTVTTVNLDEYRGLGPDHEQSYRHFMRVNLFDQVDIRPDRTYLPDGLAADPEAECRRYDALVESLGGTDLQLLGMGHNGHIGFNEPGTAFIRETHVVDLTRSTIEANARFFQKKEEVPRQAITMGVGTIMSARRVLVAVSGADKAEAVRRAFCGPITPEVPASILQLHRDVVLVGDVAALSGMREEGVFQ